jgi:glycosyltransferase involved in cell wall biosynthesis
MRFPNGSGGSDSRIAALALWDSADKSAVSGTAFGLTRALEELGVDLLRVEGRPPRRVLGLLSRGTRLRWRLAERYPGDTWRRGIESTMARRAVARRRLNREGPVDGIVQLASDLLIRRRDAQLATYDDMTIQQAVAAGYAEWKLAPRDLKWRIELQTEAYREAVACCTRSAWTARSIEDDYGIDPGKVKVVGVGRNREVQPAPGRSWESPRFVFVAKDWERKNGERVLEAFAQVKRIHPDARLDLVGNHPRVDQPGAVPHGFLGLAEEAEQAKVDELFAEATCFVMPSLHEPLGISYAEAGAAGIPSIGTANGGAREVIGPGGRVIDPLDLDQLVEAMLHYCEPAVAAAAGERALVHSQLYTWPRVAKRILNALGMLSPDEDPEAAFLPKPE